ncbi:MAG: tRNA uridine-5-carboxymethylaminomethyl(34) synthesis enzyme MnmG [Ignavibacteriales bacterium]|nr:tRNA uridine-5-carboxymethylaminomethyl(34) synthesis enzyme MnmG [Ignavibacteriales bacterium]
MPIVQSPQNQYDVVVVGGGHAGIEACLAASRMKCSTLLVTLSAAGIGRMSCNPAIGGTAKGHLVKEIDSLGGEMGKIADESGIHFRMLNTSKGPAVWSPRSQNDRELYSRAASNRLLSQAGLDLLEDDLLHIHTEGEFVVGVSTRGGHSVFCAALVICTGTFLNGLMHTGQKSREGGRFGERSSRGISERLVDLGFVAGRLKTGTPPRIDLDSIDLSRVEVQPSDDPPNPFSHTTRQIKNQLVPMYLTYTNTETHAILRKGFDRSPLFTGRIKGVGPRYCPSIEDKVNRFADRDRHHIFLEPEGYNTNVVYVNGFSTSLPEEIQFEALRSIAGLERVEMIRPGYAVEYDFFPPHQLNHTLETKLVHGLFFAGQINGTSGYEEAAGQGLMAGINAALAVQDRPPLILRRDQAYIAVMIDDLINKSTDEPYRMFTSRAEHRLLLRQDNSDRRLMSIGYSLGLISEESHAYLDRKERLIEKGISFLLSSSVAPTAINPTLAMKEERLIVENEKLSQLLKRSNISIGDLVPVLPPVDQETGNAFSNIEISRQIEIDLKYEGYIARELQQISRAIRFEEMEIPETFDFADIKSLSTEGRERLKKIRPRSIGQAMRISGVTSSDISVLTIHLRKQ